MTILMILIHLEIGNYHQKKSFTENCLKVIYQMKTSIEHRRYGNILVLGTLVSIMIYIYRLMFCF